MITDTIEQVRKRRKDLMSRKNSALNDRIKQIRIEIVKLSFQRKSNPSAKNQLQEELAGLKHKLSQSCL